MTTTTPATGATCVNHPTHPAIEHCEVCGRALCAECLWYAAEGERLCQTHAARAMAQGRVVQAPEMYADAVQVQRTPLPAEPGPVIYQGNRADVLGLSAALMGVVTLVLCGTGNQLLYCLPVAALLLGVFALNEARRAVDPARTRGLAWIGAGAGGVFLVLTVLMFAFFVCIFMIPFFVALSTPGGRIMITPVP